MSPRMCYKKPMNIYYVADKTGPKLYSEAGYIRELATEFMSRYRDDKDFNTMIFSPHLSSRKLQKEFELDKKVVARGRAPKIISSMVHRHLKTPLRVFDTGSIVHCFVDPSIKTSRAVKRVFEPISAKRYIAPHLFTGEMKIFASIKDISKCDIVIAHNEYMADQLCSKLFIDQDKIRIIPMAVEPKVNGSYTSSVRLPNKYLLFAGRIERYKNLERFIKAFAEWSQKDMHLVLCGDGREKTYSTQLKKYCSQLLGDKVMFTGYLDKQGLWDAMQDATAVIEPSYINDFPELIIESQALGTPVIASDIEPHREACNESILYFDPLCGNSIKDALDAITEKKVRDTLIRTGKNNSLQYTWDKISPMYESLYRSI